MGGEALDAMIATTRVDVRTFHALPQAYRIAAEAHLALLADLADINDYHEDDIVNVSQILGDAYQHQDWALLMTFQRQLQSLLDLRGYWGMGIQLNHWACEAAQETGAHVDWASWTHHRADIHNQEGRYPLALEEYLASETMFLQLGREPQALKSRHQRAMVLRATGQYRNALRLGEAVIRRAQELGLDDWVANPLYLRALLARDRGDYNLAETTILESLRLFQEAANASLAAHCQHFYGELLLLIGKEVERARHLLLASLATSRSLSIVRRVAATQRLLGDLERHAGNPDVASAYYQQAIETCEAIGDRPQKARTLLGQAQLAYQMGNTGGGKRLLVGLVGFFGEIGDPRGAAGACLLLALKGLQNLDLVDSLVYGIRGLAVALRAGLFAPRFLIGILRRWPRF